METILYDIYLNEIPEGYEFGNAHLSLTFSRDWAWQSLRIPGIQAPVFNADTLSQTLDFQVNGVWMVERYGVSEEWYNTLVGRECQSVSVEHTFGVKPKEDYPGEFEFLLIAVYTLFPGESRLEYSARLTRNDETGAHPCRFEGFRFQLPDVMIGKSADCLVDAPGPFPFWDKTTDADNFIPAGTPFEALRDHTYRFLSAPDTGLGIMAMTNPKSATCLCVWMDTAGQVNYQPSLRKEKTGLTFGFLDERQYLLPDQLTVHADILRIELAQSFPDALARHRAYVEETIMPANTQVPAWVKDMVLLEVMPQYFDDGIRGLTAKLPFYREIGFTAIHLMPHWLGGYSPIDFYAVNPELGTVEDIQDMVCTAHALGMHVLFDLVIHGFNKTSEIPLQRPELFYHDAEGNIVPHPTWKSLSTDWAKPEYIQYMADLAAHHVEVYGIDGYRVDAASFKGPNWDPTLPYPAYMSGTAAVGVLEGMLQSLRRVNPDAVLLNEVFGPHYYRVCDLSHDNMTMGPQVFLEQLAAGTMHAEHYKGHLANVMDALPANAPRVYFARNHDTSWFYHFNGYTPAFLALDAVHVLFTIPEFFAGDPRNGPNPDDDPAIFERYRKLFALRKAFPELSRGEVLLREVQCSNLMVFTGLRRLGDDQTLVVISFSDESQDVNLTLASEVIKSDWVLFDALTGERMHCALDSISFQIKPYQIVLGR